MLLLLAKLIRACLGNFCILLDFTGWSCYWARVSVCMCILSPPLAIQAGVSGLKVEDTWPSHTCRDTGTLAVTGWRRLEGTCGDHTVQPHCSEQGLAEWTGQSFECLWGWRLHAHLGQLLRCLTTLVEKSAFIHLNGIFWVFTHCLLFCHWGLLTRAKLHLIYFHSSIYKHWQIPLCLLQAKQSQLSQSFLTSATPVS